MSYQPFLIANTRIGLERDMEPFLLPNDAYPDLEDCFMWRGRVKKRLGYTLLARLQRSTVTINSPSGNVTLSTQANGASYALADLLNDSTIVIFSGSSTTVRSQLPNAQIVPGSLNITVGAVTFADNGSGILIGTPGTNSGTINYITGALALSFSPGLGAPTNVVVNFSYYPSLPVMGLRSLEATTLNIFSLVGFDTIYSYIFNNSAGTFSNQNFYKISGVGFVWHGANYQQFWTTNYLGAMFATNDVSGIDESAISNITVAASAVITVANGANFKIGDDIFVNQVTGMTQINGLSGTVSNVAVNNVTVNINSLTFTPYVSGGVLFNLTRQIGNGVTTGDGIKWLDQDLSGWVNFQPPINGSGTSTQYLQGTQIILPYKNRLLCLNTFEGTTTGTPTNFEQRARWSQNGTIYYASPIPSNFTGGTDAQSWRDDVIGRGGFIDAPTLEAIVSAEFVKDTLIVFFERSSWQLRYTGNELLPFVWEKINTELGADSTFSLIPFDREVVGIGNVGIHACDSVNVARLDARIPDEVFAFQNENQGPQRVSGIRDYYHELVYWCVPYIGDQPAPSQGLTFPNKILVYNYVDKSYSFFNDSFTSFGYFQAANDLTWGNALTTWGESDFNWVSPQNQKQFPNVVGGNQQGFVEILMQEAGNQDSLYITAISFSSGFATITSPNHNLFSPQNFPEADQYIRITTASGTINLAGVTYKIQEIVDANNFKIYSPNASGTFTGNGTITIVNNISILTKRFNPYISEGQQVRFGYLDLYLDRTDSGQITVNVFIDEDSSTPINFTPPVYTPTVITNITKASSAVITVASSSNFALGNPIIVEDVEGMVEINGLSGIVTNISGNLITVNINSTNFTTYTAQGQIINLGKVTSNVVNTYPETTFQRSPDVNLSNAKLWKRIYIEDISQLFQIQLTLNDIQMRNDQIATSEIVLHGMILWFSKAGRLINV